MIENHRAVLFGGIQAGYESNDAYTLDLATMVGKIYYYKTVLHAAFNVWIQYNVRHLSVIGGLLEGNFMNFHIISIESYVNAMGNKCKKPS